MPASRYEFHTTEKLGPKQSTTPEGFLLCEEVALARTGMMVYGPDETPIEAGPDGIVKIFREPEDIFTAITFASAQGKAVTNDHPDEDVTPENWRDLSHGMMLNIRRGEGAQDDLMLGDLLITTKEGIKQIRERGKIEVSLGYEADYEEIGPGAGKQTNLIINHIALVDQGRCGSRCAIADSKHTTKDLSMSIKTKDKAARKTKFIDLLMAAFKAKDSAEIEELAEKAADEMEEDPTASTGDTHIHIHNGESAPATDDENEDIPTGDEDPLEGNTDPEDTQDDGEDSRWAENASEHADMIRRITALEAALGSATAADSEEELPAEAQDEFPDEVKEEASKAKDSAYFAESFQDTAALAEILVPGIRIPTYDRASKPVATFKAIANLRRQALDLAYAQPKTRGILDELLSGKDLNTKKMTCDAIRTLFRSAASMQRNANNSLRGTAEDKQNQSPAGVTSIADLNRLNAERWAEQS